ncbi:MAG: Gfo/Idh/MocA family oxidoreductase [Fimbriimonadaceae bacterium]|nr:Gfo/Idh/MocA family oxidoreductase [Fimbriimonadaceae bacterium]
MIRVAIVGCGFMGRMHANVYSILDDAQFVAAVDRKPEKAEAFASDFGAKAYTDFDEMLANEEIDAVDICLPTFQHCEYTVRAAQAGKHIMCEKPMALTSEEAQTMIEACETAKVKLMIGHCIRFWPEYAYLKRLNDDGALGKLTSINLTRYGEFPFWSTDNWLADESKSGGGVLDMHIHDTDFALYLKGEPVHISSYGTVDHRGPSQVYTTLQYEDGCVAHLQGGWNLPNHTPFKMAFRAIFERGAAIMDSGPLTIYEDGKEPVVPQFPKMEAQGGGNISDLGGYYHELKYFVDCIEQGREFETVTPQTSLQSLKTTLEEIRQLKAR